jgi:hypothetical protein
MKNMKRIKTTKDIIVELYDDKTEYQNNLLKILFNDDIRNIFFNGNYECLNRILKSQIKVFFRRIKSPLDIKELQNEYKFNYYIIYVIKKNQRKLY